MVAGCRPRGCSVGDMFGNNAIVSLLATVEYVPDDWRTSAPKHSVPIVPKRVLSAHSRRPGSVPRGWPAAVHAFVYFLLEQKVRSHGLNPCRAHIHVPVPVLTTCVPSARAKVRRRALRHHRPPSLSSPLMSPPSPPSPPPTTITTVATAISPSLSKATLQCDAQP